jgi:hypothetical protein
MARVWAHCKSGANRNLAIFNEDSRAFRFTHVKNFDTLPDLVDWLRSENLHNSIEVLYINSHGADYGDGRLELDETISLASLHRIARPLSDLMGFILVNGKLVFSGCATGGGRDGTEFLFAISRYIRHRKIIAFERETERPLIVTGRSGFGGLSTQTTGGTSVGEVYIEGLRTTPYHPHAKWVFNGIEPTVIRYPINEQASRPGMRCAYPDCPGHSSAVHQCDVPWHPASEWHSGVRPRKRSGISFG